MKYRPDIDGLRAIAVVAVLLFHGGAARIFSGGYVGVDIFFVISGFVIASTLKEDLETGHYSIQRFYSKRIRRIFPALFSTIFVTLVVGWFWLLPNFFRDFFESIVAASTFVSNIYFWKKSGYFAANAISQPLLHTWSLSVEEQFYIFIPLIMYTVFRWFKSRWIAIFLPILLASFLLSCYATVVGPTANFFFLPTRAWELLVGVLLALHPPGFLLNRHVRETLAVIGIGLIGYAVFFFSNETTFPGFNALYPCVGTALIIYTNRNVPTVIGRFLSLRPVVGIGKISYSLYLIHWPVVVFCYFLILNSPGLKQLAPISAISFVLAYLSWKYVEQPFRHLEGKKMQRLLLMGGIALTVIFSLLGWVGTINDGFPSRFKGFVAEKFEARERWNRESCFLEGNPDPAKWNYDKCQIIQGKEQTALLWGDSFAAQYVPGLINNKDSIPFNIVEYTAVGCPPVLSYKSYARLWCTDFNAKALNIIRDHKIHVVVIAARWTDMESRGLDQIRSTLAELDKMGVRTYVIGQSPQFSIDVHILAFYKGGRSSDGVDKWNIFFDPEINERLKRQIGNHKFINPLQNLCEGWRCPYRDHGVFLYGDYGHFSAEGSSRAVQSYFPLFDNDMLTHAPD